GPGPAARPRGRQRLSGAGERACAGREPGHHHERPEPEHAAGHRIAAGGAGSDDAARAEAVPHEPGAGHAHACRQQPAHGTHPGPPRPAVCDPGRHGRARAPQSRAAGARRESPRGRPRRGAMRRRLRVVLLAATLAGCAFGPAADPPLTSSLLDAMPADVPHRTASSLTLVVFPPEARPAIDTTQMAYAMKVHQLAYYAR